MSATREGSQEGPTQLVDLAVAALLVLLGLTEIWLPMQSVMGEGSPVVSTVGLVWFATHLSQRRARPWVALAGLLVWPVLGALQGGELQVLFLGQLVPVMVLVYSLARFGRGPLRVAAVVGGISFVALADLFLPLLQDPASWSSTGPPSPWPTCSATCCAWPRTVPPRQRCGPTRRRRAPGSGRSRRSPRNAPGSPASCTTSSPTRSV